MSCATQEDFDNNRLDTAACVFLFLGLTSPPKGRAAVRANHLFTHIMDKTLATKIGVAFKREGLVVHGAKTMEYVIEQMKRHRDQVDFLSLMLRAIDRQSLRQNLVDVAAANKAVAAITVDVTSKVESESLKVGQGKVGLRVSFSLVKGDWRARVSAASVPRESQNVCGGLGQPRAARDSGRPVGHVSKSVRAHSATRDAAPAFCRASAHHRQVSFAWTLGLVVFDEPTGRSWARLGARLCLA